MISVFGWPDPNRGFDQSEHALYTCYFISSITTVVMYIFQHVRFEYRLSVTPQGSYLPEDITPVNCMY